MGQTVIIRFTKKLDEDRTRQYLSDVSTKVTHGETREGLWLGENDMGGIRLDFSLEEELVFYIKDKHYLSGDRRAISFLFDLCKNFDTGFYAYDDDEKEDELLKDQDYRFHSANLLKAEEVEKYGKDTVESAPCEIIEELPDGRIYMQIKAGTVSSSQEERKALRGYFGEGTIKEYDVFVEKDHERIPAKITWKDSQKELSVSFQDRTEYGIFDKDVFSTLRDLDDTLNKEGYFLLCNGTSKGVFSVGAFRRRYGGLLSQRKGQKDPVSTLAYSDWNNYATYYEQVQSFFPPEIAQKFILGESIYDLGL